jgi:adenylate cyclase
VRLGGRVVKTIGDEIMCTFADPAKAAVAAGEMHAALREAGRGERFRSGPLRVKIGWHYGRVAWRDAEIVGEAPVIAQQVIRMAKAEEVLTSGASLDALPAALRRGARLIDRVEPELGAGAIDVYELPWEDTEDRTEVSTASNLEDARRHATLTLEHAGRRVQVSDARTHFRLGRAQDNDLPVDARFASRHHAEITFRHGRFHLRDNSTNGTLVVAGDDRRLTRLHREEMVLPQHGWIGLGAVPKEYEEEVIGFRCE